jgi:hypothetical protein
VSATHRHTSHEHEHEFEPERGLPEPLPAGERLLWQGGPDWRLLARECFHVRKLALYFAVLAVWRIVSVIDSGAGFMQVVAAGAIAIGLGVTALAFVTWMAWMSARTSVYTLTDRRVVLRVGIVLSVTFNLPLSKIESAGLHALPDDHGDIALALTKGNRIAIPHLWPHVRPWHIARPQPSLRCVADAATVARTLTTAWQAAQAGVSTSVAQPVRSLQPVRPVTARPVAEPALDIAHAA